MWEKVIELLRESMLAFSVYIGDRFDRWWDRKVRHWNEFIRWWDREDASEPTAESLLTRATEGLIEGRPLLHDEIKEELRDASEKGGIIGHVQWGIVWFSIATGKIRAFMQGLMNLRAQAVNEDLRPSLASIETAVRSWVLNPELEPVVDDILARWGIPDDQIAIYKLVTQNLLSGAELLTLINRELVTEDDAIETLRRQGYGRDDAERLVELRKFYPGPADWATLAGREAFEEDQIRHFNLDSGFDDINPATYERGGMTSEIARWYWVAHWTNPSIQQFFTMVHRQARKSDDSIWTLDDLDAYVRLADINPEFAKGLEDIAYQPLTRVDVRRMRQDGVLTYDQVKRSYLDLGYNEADALLMADWTEAWATRQERNLTRTQLENMYELRQISRIQLADLLESIGYTQDQAETISLLKSAEREEDRLKSLIARTEYEYKRQQIPQSTTVQRLIAEDMEPAQVGELVQEWDNEKVVEQALPSKDDMLGWFTAGVITSERFRDGMRDLRYSDEDIDLYAQSEAVRLSKTDLLRLLDQEAIDHPRSMEGLLALGYDNLDAQALTAPVLGRIERRRQREQAEADRN